MTDVEEDYILQVKEKYEGAKAPPGFGQVAERVIEAPFSTSGRGFGSAV